MTIISNFFDVFKNRRSVRKFVKGKTTKKSSLERIIDCGRWVLYGANIQCFNFLYCFHYANFESFRYNFRIENVIKQTLHANIVKISVEFNVNSFRKIWSVIKSEKTNTWTNEKTKRANTTGGCRQNCYASSKYDRTTLIL